MQNKHKIYKIIEYGLIVSALAVAYYYTLQHEREATYRDLKKTIEEKVKSE